jgi:1,4-alpha-glucan branching enzyme
MPGDEKQKFANLRLLFGYMYTHPGKKHLFMGGEFGQWDEWSHDRSLDWQLLGHTAHHGIWRWVQDLNHFYKSEPALFEQDFQSEGFEWIHCQDAEKSIISFVRKGRSKKAVLLVVCNFTPITRTNYRVGLPFGGFWKEVLNSDAKEYGGSGYGNLGGLEASPIPFHGKYHSLSLSVPPLGILVFKREE